MANTLLPGLLTHSAYLLSGAPVGGSLLLPIASGWDVVDGGRYKVQGTVAVAGTPDIPVARRVGLWCPIRKVLVREMFSSPAGNYVFENVRRGPWFVVAFDHTGEYNAVIADSILGEPM